MNDSTRTQGWAICIGAGLLALLFILGILNGSYMAIALPVAVITLFVLGLGGWVGYTIATIQVEADPAPQVLTTDAPVSKTATNTATVKTEVGGDADAPA